jgi:hypothetical protein
MAAASTYTPIATTTLGSATASVTFSSISGAYTDLVLVTSINASTAEAQLQVGNGSIDTGANYSRTFLVGDGSSATSGRSSNLNQLFGIATTAASTFAAGIIQFMNYSNTTTYKTLLLRSNNASAATVATAGLWRSTSAIDTVKVLAASGQTLSTGSTFTLYGIAAA